MYMYIFSRASVGVFNIKYTSLIFCYVTSEAPNISFTFGVIRVIGNGVAPLHPKSVLGCIAAQWVLHCSPRIGCMSWAFGASTITTVVGQVNTT